MKTIKKIWNYMLDTKVGFFLYLFGFSSLFVITFYDMEGMGNMIIIIAVLALLLTVLTSRDRWY